MLIWTEENKSIFQCFFKCLLAQDSNAYAKEILDLVQWSKFKISDHFILRIPFPVLELHSEIWISHI